MSLYRGAKAALSFGKLIYDYGTTHQWNDKMQKRFGKFLHSNEAINEIGSAVMSPLATIGGIARSGKVTDTLKDVYTKEAVDETGKTMMKKVKDETGKVTEEAARDLDYANIVGSLFAVNMGMRTVSGLTHDSAGNIEVAGIPMI